MKNNLYLDIHLLQTVPPSCINRDDTGSPKTAVYGGVTRARVSSQCWKRAMRQMFRESIPSEALGLRTKRIVGMVADEIKTLGGVLLPEEAAQKILEAAGLTIKSIEKGTDALFFMSIAQAKALAQLCVDNLDELKKPGKELIEQAKNALKKNPSIDVALFGRMVANDPSLNTDACAQVAHSISTHKIINEYDYFTAVDDLSPVDNSGAGHLGTVEFNSSTLYRYATLAVHKLHDQLGLSTAQVTREFIHSFVCSMPDGKQNTFANRTLPCAVLITLRCDQPINLVGAFEHPIKATDMGYEAMSAKRLVEHANGLYLSFADAPDFGLTVGEHLSELGEVRSLKDALDTFEKEIQRRIDGSVI